MHTAMCAAAAIICTFNIWNAREQWRAGRHIYSGFSAVMAFLVFKAFTS